MYFKNFDDDESSFSNATLIQEEKNGFGNMYMQNHITYMNSQDARNIIRDMSILEIIG